MGCKKQGAKEQGHYYSKREKTACHLLFFNNNDPASFLGTTVFQQLPNSNWNFGIEEK